MSRRHRARRVGAAMATGITAVAALGVATSGASAGAVGGGATATTPAVQADGEVTIPEVTPPTTFRPATGVLALRMSAPRSSVAGRARAWTLAVANTGAGDLTGVVVRGVVPRGMRLGALPAVVARTGTRIIWHVGALRAGQSTTITMPLAVGPDLRGTACNTATASAAGTGSVIARACTAIQVGRRSATSTPG